MVVMNINAYPVTLNMLWPINQQAFIFKSLLKVSVAGLSNLMSLKMSDIPKIHQPLSAPNITLKSNQYFMKNAIFIPVSAH